MNKVVLQCDCGKKSHIMLTDEEWGKYLEWGRGGIYIQDIKTLNPCEREFLKTGMCKECQEMIFLNSSSKRLKEGE